MLCWHVIAIIATQWLTEVLRLSATSTSAELKVRRTQYLHCQWSGLLQCERVFVYINRPCRTTGLLSTVANRRGWVTSNKELNLSKKTKQNVHICAQGDMCRISFWALKHRMKEMNCPLSQNCIRYPHHLFKRIRNGEERLSWGLIIMCHYNCKRRDKLKPLDTS